MQRSLPESRRRNTPAQRAALVAAYQKSGLTQRGFAAQAGIGYSTLTLWLSRAAGAKIPPPVFVPGPNLWPLTPSAPAYRIEFPRGVSVAVAPGFQPGELGALLQVVQAL